jgi:hypothetical protein
MFLKFIALKKIHFTSSAVRFAYCFKNKLGALKKHPKLSLYQK